MDYKEIRESDLPKNIFEISKLDNKVLLKVGNAKPIFINFPLILDENLAKIPAMLLDGSFKKNMGGIMFSQKKDLDKANEFGDIIKDKFGIKSNYYQRNGTKIVNFNNKSLGYFLYYCLDISKCDEHTKIPKWIWDSNRDIKKIYLRYAFDMEGSIKDPIINKEIRFHGCDFVFMKELKKFIKDEFKINFKLKKYFINDYGLKYYLYISNNAEIRKFAEIGFSLQSHQKRLNDTLKLIKPSSWEITLVYISKLGKNKFYMRDIHQLFPYLKHRRSIHERLSTLVKKGYLILNKPENEYEITNKGKNTTDSLKSINLLKLRTNPIENEGRILEFIKTNRKCWRNKISKSLSINSITVKDVLLRLEKQNKIIFTDIDRFQRKFIEIKR